MSDSTERNCNKCIHHTSGMCDSWDCEMQTVEDVKKEAVNEYVKSVVEELEKATQCIKIDGKPTSVKAIHPAQAIEIVKQGIISDDVCEWKVKSNYYVTKCSHDTDVMYGLKQDFKYCPYCGKKIKIVGD